MNYYGPEIDGALSGQGPIPKDKVLLWIESAKDLPTLAKLYRLTDESYYRIDPELGKIATCSLIQRYLLECIRQNVAAAKRSRADGKLLGAYTHGFVTWLK